MIPQEFFCSASRPSGTQFKNHLWKFDTIHTSFEDGALFKPEVRHKNTWIFSRDVITMKQTEPNRMAQIILCQHAVPAKRTCSQVAMLFDNRRFRNWSNVLRQTTIIQTIKPRDFREASRSYNHIISRIIS